MPHRIDDINRRTMARREVVHQYAQNHQLSPAERSALDLIVDEARGRPILDIGVGGGRTVDALVAVSGNYVGVDYSEPMVAAARARRPNVHFRHADARDLSFLADGSIFLAVFSCNGIGMVGHEDRLKILREVHRVLAPGGAFLMSTHNLRCRELDLGFRFPEFERTRNPAKLLVRSARFARSTARRVYNRWRFEKVGYRNDDHAMVNDVCHDYGVMLYFITLQKQREQLERMGFRGDAAAFDLEGRRVHSDTTDNSITLLARK